MCPKNNKLANFLVHKTISLQAESQSQDLKNISCVKIQFPDDTKSDAKSYWAESNPEEWKTYIHPQSQQSSGFK